MAKQAERGKMKYVIGDGKNEMDFTYVSNLAHNVSCSCYSDLGHFIYKLHDQRDDLL